MIVIAKSKFQKHVNRKSGRLNCLRTYFKEWIFVKLRLETPMEFRLWTIMSTGVSVHGHRQLYHDGTVDETEFLKSL